MRIWREFDVTSSFRSDYSQGSRAEGQLLRIVRCEFVTSRFASHSHSQEVWTGLKPLKKMDLPLSQFSVSLINRNVCLGLPFHVIEGDVLSDRIQPAGGGWGICGQANQSRRFNHSKCQWWRPLQSQEITPQKLKRQSGSNTELCLH